MARHFEQSPETAMLLEIVQVLRDEPQHMVAVRQIDDIERRYVAAAQADSRLGLQQSAARMAFIAATDKGAPFDVVSARFRAMCAVGFRDVFSELAVFLEFADACVDHGQRDAGLRILDLARERLAGSGLKPGSEFVQQKCKFIEQCRRRLNGDEAAEL